MSDTETTRGHEVTVEIDAPPELVWKAITEAEEITKWYAPEAKVTPGAGGEIWISFGKGMEGGGRIEIWDPPRHLRATLAGGPQALDYYIEAKGGSTVLRLVHSGFSRDASFDNEYDSTKNGWRMFLSILEHGLERHPRAPAANVTLMAQLRVPAEEAWKRLLGPGGFELNGAADELRAGGRYRGRAAGETLEGRVARFDRWGYLGVTVESMNNAYLSVFVESCSGVAMLTIMWILYGEAMERTEDVRTRWGKLIDGLFPEQERASG